MGVGHQVQPATAQKTNPESRGGPHQASEEEKKRLLSQIKITKPDLLKTPKHIFEMRVPTDHDHYSLVFGKVVSIGQDQGFQGYELWQRFNPESHESVIGRNDLVVFPPGYTITYLGQTNWAYHEMYTLSKSLGHISCLKRIF